AARAELAPGGRRSAGARPLAAAQDASFYLGGRTERFLACTPGAPGSEGIPEFQALRHLDNSPLLDSPGEKLPSPCRSRGSGYDARKENSMAMPYLARRSVLSLIVPLCLLAGLAASPPARAGAHLAALKSAGARPGKFTLFESGQVRPLALSP